MTGFRVTRSGHYGLDGAIEGWRPDLMTFGKVMGGGFPAAAFGGRADVMAHAVAGGAGLPGRHAVREPGRDHGRADHAAAGHRRGLRAHRRGRRGWSARPPAPRSPRPACRTSCRTSATCSASSSPTRACTEVPDFAAASAQHVERFRAFFHSMLDQGVYLPPSAFEVWFLSVGARRPRARPGPRRPARRGAAPRPPHPPGTAR